MISLRSHTFRIVAAAALTLALAGAATAQMMQQQPASPSAPTAVPSAGTATQPEIARSSTLEGAVKKVDPGAGTVQVSSGPFGLFRRTLDVTSGTEIQVEGRRGTLADLQQGSKVKASYETRDGRNLATQIDVMPSDQPRGKRQ
jgi:Cu/Ag efflux protein CusF